MNTPAHTHVRSVPDSGPITLAFAFAGAAVLVHVLSTGVPDAGDGVGHYQMARYAWQHPHVLFDAWGKPLFTLLASPFAQLGMWGIALFNAFCSLVAAWFIITHVAHIHRDWCWAVPVILFAAPQYAHTVMAGLTEPLFGTLAVTAVVLALRERWRPALCIASFLPFARPEHIVVLPVIIIAAIGYRQWRALPWALLGTVFYMLFSLVVAGDPLLAVAGSAYAGKDVYGTGPMLHFIQRMDQVIGVPLIVVSLLAMAAWPVLWWRDVERRATHVRVVFLTLAPALGILLIHSYAWWKGGYGSLGLERVLATGVPLLVLFIAHTLASAWRYLPVHRIRGPVFVSLLGVFGAFAYPEMVKRLRLPYPPDAIQSTLHEAAEKIAEIRRPGDRLYYLSPYLGVLCNVDPMDSTQAVMLYGPRSVDDTYGIRPGDLVAWDAHHARVEGYLPADSLLLSDRFRLLHIFKPPEETMVLGGVPYEILLFRREDVERTLMIDTLFAIGRPTMGMIAEQADTLGATGGMTIGPNEYPLSFRDVPLGQDRNAVRERLVVRGSVTGSYEKDQLDLVFSETKDGHGVRYATQPLSGGVFEAAWDALPTSVSARNKLYLWNRSGAPVHFERFVVNHDRMVQRSLTVR